VTETTDLRGEVILVTGASRGLGRALARAFADAGASLALCARGGEALESVAAELRAGGAAVEAGAVDVTDAAAVSELVERASDRLGPIGVAVNNASVLGPRVPLRDHSVEEWRRVIDVNLTGTLIPTLAVLPAMREAGRGSVINVSSGVGNAERKRWGAYAVSKWGVEALTRNLALEEEGSGVRANIVDPGRLRTEMRREAYPEEDPSRPAPPEAAVGVFLWLASDRSEGVTGRRFQALDWP
jgi:NAD(P)-dependent dehydrogenase (short-subunit alcohol dehydrogenase family)